MNNGHKIRNTIIKYSISFAIMTGFLFIILATRGVFKGDLEKVDIYRYLTDGFTIPGILFLLVGLLVLLTNLGSLTSLTWMMKRLFKALIPGMNRNAPETYQEYLENRKKVSGYEFLFISGAIYLAIGVVFLIMYYSSRGI